MMTAYQTTVRFLLALAILWPATAGAAPESPPTGGPPRGITLPEKETFTLPNGMKATLVPYGSVPKVSVELVVRAGNLDEGERTWLADVTGRMLEEGTESRSAEQLARDAARMGGGLDVSVHVDRTQIEGDVLSEFGPALVALLAEVTRAPAFPESALERVQNDLVRNLAAARAQPQVLANEKFQHLLYPAHPYGALYPSPEQIQGYTIEDVRAFHAAQYGARRAHIYVAGVFDKARMKAAIEEAFATWDAGPAPLELPPTPSAARRLETIDRPGAHQSTVLMGLPVIDPTHEDYVPLQVMNTLLGGAFSSRITANIREDKGYTYSPRSAVTTHVDAGTWTQAADITTNVTGPALKEIFHEIERLQTEPPTAGELDAVKAYMTGRFILRNASRGGIIAQLAFLDLHGLDESFLTNYAESVAAVTPEQVRDMAARYLKREAMTIVVVGDLAQIADQLAPYRPDA